MIGKFEELTLLALIRSGPSANAASVYQVMEAGVQRPPAFAALYTALDRLTKKGLVSERKDPNDPRGRRLFTITGAGRASLSESVNAARNLGSDEVFGASEALNV